MVSNKVVNLIEKATHIDKGDKFGFLAYLCEEVGEVAQAIATEVGLKSKKLKESAASECVDVTICALSLFFKLGGTREEFAEIFERKTKRWLERMQ